MLKGTIQKGEGIVLRICQQVTRSREYRIVQAGTSQIEDRIRRIERYCIRLGQDGN
jgi:hypothetical protein